jgi:hypothetical protein
MPLIANNMIIGDKKVEQPTPKVSSPPADGVPMIPLEKVSRIPRTKFDKEHSILIVDGVEKKISKHSAYILDMLSVDKE